MRQIRNLICVIVLSCLLIALYSWHRKEATTTYLEIRNKAATKNPKAQSTTRPKAQSTTQYYLPPPPPDIQLIKIGFSSSSSTPSSASSSAPREPHSNATHMPPKPKARSPDACSLHPDLIFRQIFDLFLRHGIPLILIEKADLSERWRDYLEDDGRLPRTMRLGVFGENSSTVADVILPEILGLCKKNLALIKTKEKIMDLSREQWSKSGKRREKRSGGDVKSAERSNINNVDNNTNDNSSINGRSKTFLTNIFIIIKTRSNISLPAPLKRIPFYPWRRLHFRFIHQRGSGAGYRWMGHEPDDEGNFKLPAEAFQNFQLKPLQRSRPFDGEQRKSDTINNNNNSISKDDNGFHEYDDDVETTSTASPFFFPSDIEFFLWQKDFSEFKECNSNNFRIFNNFSRVHPTRRTGRRITNHTQYMPYIKSILAVQSVLFSHRVMTWVNCGILLGWFRQCSIIPGDGDIDMAQWNAFDDYPALIEAFKRDDRFQFQFAFVEYHPVLGHKRAGDQDAFYIRVWMKEAGKGVDIYFQFKHKIQDTEFREGSLNSTDFTDSICSADLHGFLVHVPCSPNKIDEIFRTYYPGNYMIPNR